MLRALSDILSNSSMQQTPLSLSTRAPLSSTISRVSASCTRRAWNPGPSQKKSCFAVKNPFIAWLQEATLQSRFCQQYASMGLGPCEGIHRVGVLGREGKGQPW